MKRINNLLKPGLAIVFVILPISCGGGDGPTSSEPEFNLSGDPIAFRNDRDGADDIWLMTPAGSELINITNNPADDSVSYMAVAKLMLRI